MPQPNAGSHVIDPTPPHPVRPRCPAGLALGAWFLLAAMDVTLRLGGFDRFIRILARWPTLDPTAASAGGRKTLESCAAVDRARMYYFKRAWCLQSAAATMGLLRLRGVKADFVIGVRKVPFLAHAWTEVGQQVVMNDRPGLHTLYTEIARC